MYHVFYSYPDTMLLSKQTSKSGFLIWLTLQIS